MYLHCIVFIFFKVGACRRQEKTGGVGLSATSPRCGRASLAVGFSLLSLTLAYASVAYTQEANYGITLNVATYTIYT